MRKLFGVYFHLKILLTTNLMTLVWQSHVLGLVKELRTEAGPGEIVKCLPCKHGNLSSDLSKHVKSMRSTVACTCNPRTEIG